jgi:Cu(I)/Ag(I) efflux system membrane fusion protein
MKEQSLEVPGEFRGQLAGLIPPYLAIGDALAGDDVRNLTPSIERLNNAIGAIDPQNLTGTTLKRWQAEHKSLMSIAERLVKANDINTLRSSFALLSDQLLTLQRTFGIQNSDQLFELHCPMAFEGRGASWIQADSAVRNPYYGATMLKCADRVVPLTGHAD